ncbi:MAG: hypothetical protein KC466_08650, partial [Myxococcales bacterium]|nr:hypothetical protein [Myxococcales bacterium]
MGVAESDAEAYAVRWAGAPEGAGATLARALRGGRIHFRGSRRGVLEGSPDGLATILEVTRHPNVEAARRAGTLARRIDPGVATLRMPPKDRDHAPYLVHRFACAPGYLSAGFKAIARAADAEGARVHFAGEI